MMNNCDLLTGLNDPLDNLVPDVFEYVFQHLSWKELIVSSEVNRMWYLTIGESSQCMNKVKLKIQNLSHQNTCSNIRNDLQRVLPHIDYLISSRQYRNVYVDFLRQNKNDVLKTVLSPSERKWKNVELVNANFDDSTFLKHFNKTVEKLSFKRINCNINDRFNKTSFPQLKSLKTLSCDENLLEAVTGCSTLNKLQISEIKSDELTESQKCAETFLIQNSELETLIVLANSFTNFFPNQVVANCRFQLKKLVVSSWGDSSSKSDRESLKNFLRSQSSSLKVLDIDPWCGLDVLRICFQIPHLTDFTFNVEAREENLDWNSINFACSHSLERIHIRSASQHEPLAFYDATFKAAPNLRVYKAKFMHTDDLIALSSRCKRLEELYIEMFNVQLLGSEDCLPKLKIFKSWDINDELLKTIEAKGTKNKFEELITSL